MDTHFKNQLLESSRLIFRDCQNFQIANAMKVFVATQKKEDKKSFWLNISKWFNQTEVKTTGNKNVPCDFIPDSTSAGRHRQHFYINDKSGKSFQVYALMHRDQMETYNDDLCLGAIGYALTKGDPKQIQEWFKDFRQFSNIELKRILAYSIESINVNEQNVKDILNTLFYLAIYDFKFDLTKYEYEGFPKLDSLFKMYKNSNYDIEEYNFNVSNLLKLL